MSRRDATRLHIITPLLEGPYGGGNQFCKALRAALRRQGRYAERAANADILLISGFPSRDVGLFETAFRWRSRRGAERALLIRLDGPIGLVRGDPSSRRFDDALFAFADLAADGIVIQSAWSLARTREMETAPRGPITVIGNAADPEIFFPPTVRPDRTGKLRIMASSWSPNKNKGFNVYQWLDRNLDFERYDFTFVGASPVAFDNIAQLPPQPSAKLADLIRQHDIYITASVLESCSNAVIEALQCGLPVIAPNSSSHPEIIGDMGSYFDRPQDIPEALETIAKVYDTFRLRVAPESIDAIAGRYMDFADEVLGQSDRRLSRQDFRDFEATHAQRPNRLRRGIIALKQGIKDVVQR